MTASDRLLTIIRSFNEIGSCTVLELHRETRIPRTAIYRAVETLRAHGYVQRVPNDNHYRLTSRIRQLSAGFRDHDWIAEAAAPTLEKLQRQLVWPASLSTIDNDRMIIRETTRYRSPFVFDAGGVGVTLPVLGSAIGLAYLAFCNPSARRIALKLLRASTDPADAVARDERATEQLLRTTRRRGYGYRSGGAGPNTSAIATPVMGEDGAIAALGMSFATSVVKQQQAVAEFLPALRTASLEISKYLAASVHHPNTS